MLDDIIAEMKRSFWIYLGSAVFGALSGALFCLLR